MRVVVVSLVLLLVMLATAAAGNEQVALAALPRFVPDQCVHACQPFFEPEPTPNDAAPEPRPLGYGVVLALACLFGLSVLALTGGIAMKRRFDALNPDE